jgi:hypothetical protein
MIELIILGATTVVGYAAIIFMYYLTTRERSKLLDRIMARTYQEYEYHDKMYETDIKETEKLRDEAREERLEDDEIKQELDVEYRRERDMLKEMDEDWEEEEVDMEKFRERTAEKTTVVTE